MRVPLTLLALSLFLLAPYNSLHAKPLESTATAASAEEAKSAALDELSQSIIVQVKAHHEITQSQHQNPESSNTEETLRHISHITLESSAQFIQPKITYKKLSKRSHQAHVLIDDPAPYKAAIEKLSIQIDALSIGIDSPITQRDLKDRIYKLENIITMYRQYTAYALVLEAMDERVTHAPRESLGYFASKYAALDPKMFEKTPEITAKEQSPTTPQTTISYRFLSGYDSLPALLRAIKENNADGVYSALKHKLNPNLLDEYGTPLLILAIEKPELVTLLLEFGANPEEPDNEGYTPLLYAISQADTQKTCRSIHALLKHGASPNHSAQIDSKTQIPLLEFYRKFSMSPNFAGKFWEDQGIYYCDKRELIELFIAKGADINARDDRNASLLGEAALSSDLDLARRLLDLGAKPDPHYDQANTNTPAGKSIQTLLNHAYNSK